MGFRGTRSSQWNLATGLRSYGLVLLRKMAFIAIGWLVVYFITQPFRPEGSILMLFAPMIGALAGLVAGWYMATDAAEDSGLFGLGLWVILVAASVLPMWGVEGIMHLILPKRPFNFGGWMVLSAANLLALAAAVWHESSQE